MVTVRTSSKDTRFERVSFIAPLVAGGLIAGGASLLGGAMSALTGLSSQNKYLKGVRETNETNLQLAREQRAWDLEQWNRENEYNSAAAQMSRWQAAGLSPQSFVGAGSPGEAAALQSPSMANQVGPSDLSGYAGVTAQGIQQGLQGAADAALKWKQMDLNQAQLNIDKQRLANETKGVEAEVTYKQALTDQAKANIKYIEAQAKMTDQQRYKFEAETELAWQKWQQLAKLFPLEYESKEVSLAMSKLDKVLNQETLEERIKSFAIQNSWTVADTKMKLKQAIYWHFQGREGEFQVTTQPLRFDLLNWQQQQFKFDLDFSKNTRYSQLRFENAMKGVHAFFELGSLAVDVAGELRAWIHPSSYTWNYNFLNQSGSSQRIGR